MARRQARLEARTLGVALLACAAAPAVVASCGSDGAPREPTATSVGGDAGTAGGGQGGGGEGGLINQGGGPACTASSECDGGVCVKGQCCGDPTQVCGEVCCAPGTVCLFDHCAVPGKPCHSAADCDPGQYCETALGEEATDAGSDGGFADAADGAACTAPLPLDGKCLDLPPVCDPDAGAPDPGCIPACEYHPDTGPLDAVVEWEWGSAAQVAPDATDVWATPTVGRVYDANCDGKVDVLDPPNVVFVSAKARDVATGKGTCCQCTGQTPTACVRGVLRVLDGRTGQELWSLEKPEDGSIGFTGLSVAIGDVDGDARMDVVAVSGEGHVVVIDGTGKLVWKSDAPIPGHGDASFGWGGGLALADMDGDGWAEIAYGSTVFKTSAGGIELAWTGKGGIGGGNAQALSTFADVDLAPDGNLELLGGNTAYRTDGSVLWSRDDLPDGFPAVGDFDHDGKPEVVMVANGKTWLLDGATGATKLGPVTLPGKGFGGPPTIADFDGGDDVEIGVAQANFYSVLKPDFAQAALAVLWQTANHDLSSSVTGSSVFDFEGDGRAEVVYGDECFLWVYDGETGEVRFATPHTSFTATEASLVADVDGDGRSEIVMVSNRADPSAEGWGCDVAPWNEPDPATGRPAWEPPPGSTAYRGIVVFGSKSASWVGTRTLWNQHTYHVTNVCDDRDDACEAPNAYGTIPKKEKPNWTVPWLDNFRQNVQDKGLFDAPDATVALFVECSTPVVARLAVRNAGLATLPAGVGVGVFVVSGAGEAIAGQAATTHPLFPGQTELIDLTLDPEVGSKSDTFVARILVDAQAPTFHECREDNNASDEVTPTCVQ